MQRRGNLRGRHGASFLAAIGLLTAFGLAMSAPPARAQIVETCAMGIGPTQSPDGRYHAMEATCSRLGKLQPIKAKLTDTRTGRATWTNFGGPNGEVAGFFDSRTLASAWTFQVDGHNQLTLLLQDVTGSAPERRHVIDVPPDLRFFGVEQGEGCALLRVFGRGGAVNRMGRWYLANSEGLKPVDIGTSQPAGAFWLGARRVFVIGDRDETGAIQPLGSVDCQGRAGPADMAAVPTRDWDVVKSSWTTNLVVVGNNDEQWDAPPDSQVSGDVTVIRVHGVMAQQFAVSGDGLWFAVDRFGTTTVYRSRDLAPIATLTGVDNDRHIFFAVDAAAILFTDDWDKVQRRPFTPKP